MNKGKIKRGPRKNKQRSEDPLKFFYNNINGYNSRNQSLKKIISEETPDVVALCETKRQLAVRQKKDEIPGYEVIERNLKQGKEGLMVAVKVGTFRSIEEVTQSELRNILTVRIGYPKDVVRVVLLHAPQESDPLEERMDFFEEVAIQVERCITAGDKLVVLGDFNARVIMDENEVRPASPNGKLLHDLLQDNDLKVSNFSPNTKGEWTRIQRTKSGINKSTIDYVLLQDEGSVLSEMLIDEDKIYCPYSERRTKNGKSIIFSDHCAIILTLQIKTGGLENHTTTQKVWNFSQEGYEAYKKASNQPMVA